MGPEIIRAEHLVKSFTVRKPKSVRDHLFVATRGRDQGLTRRVDALADVSFSIHAGESVGIVGPNGAGKTTLLKLIGNIVTPDSGRLFVRGRTAALLALGTGFHPDLSGRDNIYLNAALLGLSKTQTNRVFDAIVEFSGLDWTFIDTPVKFYSTGMYVRLAFSVAVHSDPDILLVDEVLAVGDEAFQAKCLDKIGQFQSEGRTILFVSHRSTQVAEVCDRVLVIQHGSVVEDDTPLVALRRLRDIYQGQADAERQAVQARSAEPVLIESVRLTSIPETFPHSQYQVVSRPGFDLEVHCDLDFRRPTPDWSLSVLIETTMGEERLATDSGQSLKMKLPEAVGRQHVRVTFPDLRLGVGDYAVSVIVRDSEGNRLGENLRAAVFAVRWAENTQGVVYSEARLDLLGGGSARECSDGPG
jgi:ABC-2 type transport system ATP-binding protein